MTERDIEQKVRSAFENSVPDVLDSVLEQCSDTKGQVISMTENPKKRMPILKILAIAAAVAILFAGTVTAISFTGLISKDDAFFAAYNHLYSTAEGEEKTTIGNLLLGGMTIEGSAELTEADLGFAKGRAVYNISFRLIERIYEYVIDAKTGVVLDYSSRIDPDFDKPDENLHHYDHEVRYSAAEETAEYDRTYAYNVSVDYFGMHPVFYNGKFNFYCDGYDEGYYDVMMVGGGYIYTCKVDMQTGELSDPEIAEDDLYTGEERFNAEHYDGVIGLVEATRIAVEDSGYGDREGLFTSAFLFPAVMYNEDGSTYSIQNNYDVDIYQVEVYDMVEKGPQFMYSINAVTGEILKVTDPKRIMADDIKVIRLRATNAANDYSGINSGMLHFDSMMNSWVEILADDNILVTTWADGYIYETIVERGTYNILDCKTWEDKNHNGARYEHSKIEGIISSNEALDIAAEALGIEDLNAVDFIYGTYFSDRQEYSINFQNGNGSESHIFISVAVDAVTGEVTSVSDHSSDSGRNQVPSAEAPDGMISETRALIIALEDMGVTENNIRRLTITLDGNVYTVSWEFSNRDTAYKIDAVSGKILGTEGVTAADYIGEDAALKAVLDETGRKKEELSSLEVMRVSQYGMAMYKITFVYQDVDCSFNVDAFDGRILEFSYPFMSVVSDKAVLDVAHQIAKAELERRGIPETSIKGSSSSVYYSDYDVTRDDGTVESIKLVVVEITTYDCMEFGFGIDPESGEIIVALKIDPETGEPVDILND